MYSLQQMSVYERLFKKTDFRSAKFKFILRSHITTIFRKRYFQFYSSKTSE